jgi:putative ATP-dependent endonuclease of OLD family
MAQIGQVRAPTILRLTISRYRGIEQLDWTPTAGLNVILGGGDVGKTTILSAIGLLLSPTNLTPIWDTDYHSRDTDKGFVIEAVFRLPEDGGISNQLKPAWPWHWNGKEAVVPSAEDGGQESEPVYRLRVSGGPDLEPVFEIVQPDGTTDNLSVGLRRSIGLVRLLGDDLGDRDLRLVQGSALDRLLADKALRGKLRTKLADTTDIKDSLTDEARASMKKLDAAFTARALPGKLDLAITGGGQGTSSIAALIGLTAERGGCRLPLASWGAGTRRLAALTVAGQNQGEAAVTLVDEIERGLEPYRQRALVDSLQNSQCQAFIKTHSPTVIAAATDASIWYLDHTGSIGEIARDATERLRKNDPNALLARLTVVAEGSTEQGFVVTLLRRAVGP